jgi:hypothetical protein
LFIIIIIIMARREEEEEEEEEEEVESPTCGMCSILWKLHSRSWRRMLPVVRGLVIGAP